MTHTMENENSRISGDQGSIKPEATLTDIFRKVAKNRESNDAAPMRAAANAALIRWLKEVEGSDIEADTLDLEYALGKHGFSSVNELVDALFEAGEPIMAGARQELKNLDGDKIGMYDHASFELKDADEGGDDGQ